MLKPNGVEHINLFVHLCLLGIHAIVGVLQAKSLPLPLHNFINNLCEALLICDHLLREIALSCFVVSLDILLQCVVATTYSDLYLVTYQLTVEDLYSHQVLAASDVNDWDFKGLLKHCLHLLLKQIIFGNLEVDLILLTLIEVLIFLIELLLFFSGQIKFFLGR